jgi:inosine-uridine nucleoside N-ribohydrolase
MRFFPASTPARTCSRGWFFVAFALLLPAAAATQQPSATPSQKVIIDTDIGDDVDDAFAVDLALASPELNILGISSAWGDTALRARMLDRMLCETGRTSISVNLGIPTKASAVFTQAPWAKAGIEHAHADAVSFLLEQANKYPGEITLLAIGPLTNVGAAIDKNPAAFRKLKRVVIMGGSIHRGYGENAPPEPEYNIARDPRAAQKLFQSGVPIFVLPLDSTQIKFEETKRSALASVSTPLTDSLQILIAEWKLSNKDATPTLFDAVAAAYTLDATSCPMTPLHIEVDDKGLMTATSGTPNAQACLEPHGEKLFGLLMPRLLEQNMIGHQACLAIPKD